MTHNRDQEPAQRATTSSPLSSSPAAAGTEPTAHGFAAIAATPEYATLRRAFRSFAFPMTIAGLASYFVYVIASIYATDAMATPLIGSLNVGMALGLFQFVVTYAWTAIYVRYASRRLDPIAADLKARLVGEEPA